MELRQTGHKIAHLLFTPGEDRLLTRALLRFGTDTKRAHLYFMPARSEAEIEQRTSSRAHNRAPSNVVKARTRQCACSVSGSRKKRDAGSLADTCDCWSLW